jgi:hypothetical protein
VRLVSRAASPQELGLARDPRMLGVGIESLSLVQGGRRRIIGVDDPVLNEGFHAFEAEAGLRWTTGEAVLPLALFGGEGGAVDLIVQLGGSTQYLDGAAEVERRTAA